MATSYTSSIGICKKVWLLSVFLTSGWATLFVSQAALGQAAPNIPFDIEFAGVTVHLTQNNQLKVKEEVEKLYAKRSVVTSYVYSIQQLAPLLNPLLRASNIPPDFIHVAPIFPDVNSVGYWGTSLSKGHQLKLTSNGQIDERLHPLVCTQAALRDIDYWHRIRKNYVASLLDYLNINGDSSVPDRLSAYYIMPNAQSSSLFWKVIARKLVFDHEMATNQKPAQYILYEYKNGGGKTLQDIAQQLQVSAQQVITYNTWLRTSRIPTQTPYPVIVQLTPSEFTYALSGERQLSAKQTNQLTDIGFPIVKKSTEKGEGLRSAATYYSINGYRGIQAQNCDNVITLSFLGKLSVNTFLKYNDLTATSVISPGTIYYLEPKAKRAKVPFHIVQNDQSLRSISAMYGVKIKSLQKFNHVKATQRLQTGRVLWLQRKRPTGKAFEYIQQVDTENNQSAPEESTPEKVDLPTQSVDDSTTIITELSDETRLSYKPLNTNETNTAALSPESELDPDDTIVEETPKDPMLYHCVVAGETYHAIARQHAVTVQQLYSWNNRTASSPLKTGDMLLIQKQSPTPSKADSSGKPSTDVVRLSDIDSSQYLFHHTVKPGQTLYRIALIHKVAVKDLMNWNHLSNYTIEVGQQLIIRK
ncbi:LysM peptidoglycan-binding domain-containing protein [Spirosoma terrae]|uniref:LysM peptidoglycan-binding domain-containing protein n=1 Tax=Spirosoma terrae TaxID=1968276 RepID=A0A6L9L8R6_9BACT|nr:LysM peptidoglycan-binding domain-containing protein [Spirosoma terrae]NDU96985.1 LysM peptidoglycan-binding domain-containing protein [Spirosoma terrae]